MVDNIEFKDKMSVAKKMETTDLNLKEENPISFTQLTKKKPRNKKPA